MLNKAEEEMPSTSDVAKVDDIELQETTENSQLEKESSKDLPMCRLLGLDKELRSVLRFVQGGGVKKGLVGRKY